MSAVSSTQDTNASNTITTKVAAMTRLLGHHPVVIMDDIFNSAHDYLCDGVDCLEKSVIETLQNQNPSKTIETDSIRVIVDNLHNALKHKLDRNLDKMELYTLKHILNIPAHIQMDTPEDEDISNNTVNILEELQAMESAQDRRRGELSAKLAAAKAMQSALKTELSMFDEVALPVINDLKSSSVTQTQNLVDIQDNIGPICSKAAEFVHSSLKLRSSFSKYQQKVPSPTYVSLRNVHKNVTINDKMDFNFGERQSSNENTDNAKDNDVALMHNSL